MRFKNPIIAITEIADLVIRKNFQSLVEYFNDNGQLDGFVFLENEVTSNQENLKIKHNLGYVPKDVIITRLIAPSAANLEINHGLFDTDNINVTITGLAAGEKLSFRAFVGSYKGSDNTTQLKSTDIQEYPH